MDNINSDVIDMLNNTLDQTPYYWPVTWEGAMEQLDKEELSEALRGFCKKPAEEGANLQNLLFGAMRKHLEHCRKVKEQ